MRSFKNLVIVLTCVSFGNISYADLLFDDAKVYVPLKGSNATVAYVVIKNNSDEDVEIYLNKFEGFKKAETHETIEKDGRMSMQKVEKFKILARGQIELKPNGKHIMLFDAINDIKVNSFLKAHFLVNTKEVITKFKVVSRFE